MFYQVPTVSGGASPGRKRAVRLLGGRCGFDVCMYVCMYIYIYICTYIGFRVWGLSGLEFRVSGLGPKDKQLHGLKPYLWFSRVKLDSIRTHKALNPEPYSKCKPPNPAETIQNPTEVLK